MNRWINAKWLEENAKQYSLGYYEADERAVPIALFDEAPSIDIVRCEDCRYCIQHVVIAQTADGEFREVNMCTRHNWYIGSDAFCSFGERRDNETD